MVRTNIWLAWRIHDSLTWITVAARSLLRYRGLVLLDLRAVRGLVLPGGFARSRAGLVRLFRLWSRQERWITVAATLNNSTEKPL